MGGGAGGNALHFVRRQRWALTDPSCGVNVPPSPKLIMPNPPSRKPMSAGPTTLVISVRHVHALADMSPLHRRVALSPGYTLARLQSTRRLAERCVSRPRVHTCRPLCTTSTALFSEWRVR
jgi:hypothetical protein